MTGGKRRIKVGLVGLGRLGRIYARDLATRIPETRLSAVADPDEAALADVSATYDARPHRDPETLFQDSDVEAIVIASPTHTHAALTVAASGAGKPIFCEKPPALSLAETARAVDQKQPTTRFTSSEFPLARMPKSEAAELAPSDVPKAFPALAIFMWGKVIPPIGQALPIRRLTIFMPARTRTISWALSDKPK